MIARHPSALVAASAPSVNIPEDHFCRNTVDTGSGICTYAPILLIEGVFRRRSADGARVRRPRTGFANLDPGGLRGSTWASLRAPRQELADGQVAITSGVSEKRGPRTEIAAVERREARRSAWTGNLRQTGDRPDREAGNEVRRSAPA